MVEQVWSILKKKVTITRDDLMKTSLTVPSLQVDKDFPRDVPSLKASILRAWKEITPSVCFAFVSNMHKKVQMVLAAEGKATKV